MDAHHSDAAAAAANNGLSFSQDTPRSDVDEILRRKRKAREYKACYPCRQRKVKCDQSVPCKTCVVREHPELCTYHPPAETHPPAKRLHTATNGTTNGAHAGGTVTISREDWDRICSKLHNAEKALADLRGTVRTVSDSPHHTTHQIYTTPSTPVTYNNTPASAPAQYGEHNSGHLQSQGIHARNNTGQTVHLGASSVPALLMALDQPNDQFPGVQEVLGKKNILPIFGLDNDSATYPFVDLWGLPHGSLARANELANALPVDNECLNYFRFFRETSHVVYPALADAEQFESDLLMFLINRASAQSNGQSEFTVTEEMIYGKNIQWIGLLFATLASGCQCSNIPRKERELTAQVYVCCSFECLRFTNFLSQATLETIQTLLILGNVISNNMNAGVAWSLLGLTFRLAQSLGLHKPCPPTTDPQTKNIRTKVWWAVLWQDALISITYDRASSAVTSDHDVPLTPNAAPGTRSYEESMYRVCHVGMAIVRERSKPQASHEALLRITEHRNELQDIMIDAADYLRDSRRCRSVRDQLEHWALYLHVSYIMSELCRPAISPSTSHLDLSKTLRKTCIDSLTNTVEAFLGLANVTVFASRSWAALHRALSSALLLGILGEPSRNERAHTLLGSLIAVLSDITSTVDPAERSAPITRSITALQKLLTLQDVRSGRNGEGGDIKPSPTMAENLEYINGALNFDDTTFVTQSPLIGLDTEQSPYALMDSILWGSRHTP